MDLPIPGKSQSNFPDHSAERSAISHEIDDCLRKLFTLKIRLNALSHVNQLPNEILAQILVTSSQGHYHSATGHWDKSTFKGPAWIKLAHVCQHWRDVALNAPRFWSHVYVRKPNSFCALLPLSKSSPLHVNFTVPADTLKELGLWNSAIELLGQQSHRLRELHYVAPQRQVSKLAEKLGSPMRLLEKLVLSHCDEKDWVDALEPIHFLPATEYAPRLLHLEIHQLPIAWVDPVFCPTLTTLVIVGKKPSREPRPSPGTFEQFLGALEAMAHSLVHLTLEECMSQAQSAASQPRSSTRSVTFTSLKRLKIKGTTDNCVFLLGHLSVNRAARLTVEGFGLVGIPRLIEILSAHVARTTPLSKLEMSFPYPTSRTVNITGHSSSITDSRLPHRPFDLKLTSHTDYLVNDPNQPLTAVLKAAKALFSSVTTLSVWPEETLPTDIDWQRLFARAPSVQVLDVCGHPGRGLLDALTLSDAQLKKKRSAASLRSLPLRQLRDLSLYGAHFHQRPMQIPGHGLSRYTFFGQLLDWAMLRCDYQAPLHKLDLMACKDTTANDVDRLREVIVDVEWDGREGESSDEDNIGFEYRDSDSDLY